MNFNYTTTNTEVNKLCSIGKDANKTFLQQKFTNRRHLLFIYKMNFCSKITTNVPQVTLINVDLCLYF